MKRVIDFDLSSTCETVGFNLLYGIPFDRHQAVASGLLGAVGKMRSRYWGPRMEHFLRNALQTLLEPGDMSIAHIPRVLLDQAFRPGGVIRRVAPIPW